MILGIDTGGTFTDFVLIDETGWHTHKVLSTPHAPEIAILQGIESLGLNVSLANKSLWIVHGSTVATNALLENKGAKTVYISNYGLGDVLNLKRQARSLLYDLQPSFEKPVVEKSLCLETGGRLAADGSIIETLTHAELSMLVKKIAAINPEAVAINLLFSFLDDRFEKEIESAINNPSIFVSRSSAVLPESREYERGIATFLNARLGPIVFSYLNNFQKKMSGCPITVMQSSGGTTHITHASTRAVNLLLSGPAGGLAAAEFLGNTLHRQKLLTFDMGGTSTDVALIDKKIALSTETVINGFPICIPMVDMHTIGAGGGSIAYLDAGGLLQVGPQSAGASPGPACYGLGGHLPTVTDANLVLGRLRANAFLGGNMPLDVNASRMALATLAGPLNMRIEDIAAGIIDLANEHMTRALKLISVERGIDPTHFTLCSFGGAGGLHACALAENLNIKNILIPTMSGVLSALGMLVAPRIRQLSKAYHQRIDCAHIDRAKEILKSLCDQGWEELEEENIARENTIADWLADLRYTGQSNTLTIPWQDSLDLLVESFHNLHKKRYGHALSLPIEIVNLRVSIKSDTPPPALPKPKVVSKTHGYEYVTLHGIALPVAIWQRNELGAEEMVTGPAIIIEEHSTTFLQNGWMAYVDQIGNLLLRRMAVDVYQ